MLTTDDDNGWLPIATAPKSGDFLVCRPYGSECRVEIVNVYKHYRDPTRIIWQTGTTYGNRQEDFTHWRPLPAPPKGNTQC